jgi:hypothetical protein
LTTHQYQTTQTESAAALCTICLENDIHRTEYSSGQNNTAIVCAIKLRGRGNGKQASDFNPTIYATQAKF